MAGLGSQPIWKKNMHQLKKPQISEITSYFLYFINESTHSFCCLELIPTKANQPSTGPQKKVKALGIARAAINSWRIEATSFGSHIAQGENTTRGGNLWFFRYKI